MRTICLVAFSFVSVHAQTDALTPRELFYTPIEPANLKGGLSRNHPPAGRNSNTPASAPADSASGLSRPKHPPRVGVAPPAPVANAPQHFGVRYNVVLVNPENMATRVVDPNTN